MSFGVAEDATHCVTKGKRCCCNHHLRNMNETFGLERPSEDLRKFMTDTGMRACWTVKLTLKARLSLT